MRETDAYGVEWNDEDPTLEAVRQAGIAAGLDLPEGSLRCTRHWSEWDGGYLAVVLEDGSVLPLMEVLGGLGWVVGTKPQHEHRPIPGGEAHARWTVLAVYGDGPE